ncbi:MAG: tetratricopeptide repeat protein [Bacteroidetes bacterium]|nr:tetratricopeptide repeat protein [Bacteroidota bacterium]
MLTAKKKISAREAVPTSSTADFFYRAQEWFSSNTKLVGGVALGVAAVIIIGYLYVSGKAADDIAANRELRKVQEYYQQQQYKIAIAGDPAQGVMGLEEITDKYSGTPTAEVAGIYLGNAYLYSGDHDKALAVFEDASPDTDMLKAAVLAGRAAVHEARQEYGEAADLFERAARLFKNDVLSNERLLSAGRAYALAGNMENAKEVLDEVALSDNQQYKQEAQKLLAQYGLE